jgi:copper chaperone CopZ
MNLKKLTSGIALAILIITQTACGGKSTRTENETVSAETAGMEVSIGGMSCTGCEQTIQTNIGKLEGIKSVKASFTVGNALIEYDPGMVDSLKIKEAITGSGYTVKKCSAVKPEKISM